MTDSDYEAASNDAPSDFPWPPRENVSILDAAATTWQESVFHPASFFRRMPREFGFGWVLGYYVALGVVAAGLGMFWTMVLGPSIFERLILRSTPDRNNPLVEFLLTPIIVVIALFIAAGIVHLFLKMFGGNKHGFGTTIRVLCYASGPQLFYIVPVIGGLIAGIWGLVLTVIGLREAHETTTGKAVAAILVPTVLFVLLTLLLIMLALMLGVGRLSG